MNRFVLIHNGERVLDTTGVEIMTSVQDGGMTLKVFVGDMLPDEKATAAADHLVRLSESLSLYQDRLDERSS